MGMRQRRCRRFDACLRPAGREANRHDSLYSVSNQPARRLRDGTMGSHQNRCVRARLIAVVIHHRDLDRECPLYCTCASR
jgi:hypothetical protein